jgi:hypothetical protein
MVGRWKRARGGACRWARGGARQELRRRSACVGRAWNPWIRIARGSGLCAAFQEPFRVRPGFPCAVPVKRGARRQGGPGRAARRTCGQIQWNRCTSVCQCLRKQDCGVSRPRGGRMAVTIRPRGRTGLLGNIPQILVGGKDLGLACRQVVCKPRPAAVLWLCADSWQAAPQRHRPGSAALRAQC